MSLKDQWRRAFAVQARADLETREFLRSMDAGKIPECHRLQFLQMACEKLVKAHMFTTEAIPSKFLTSHADTQSPADGDRGLDRRLLSRTCAFKRGLPVSDRHRMVFDALRQLMVPPPAPKKKPIGLQTEMGKE